MELTFGSNKLEKLANDYRKCQKELGQIRAKLYNKRLLDLHNAETLEDVRNLPGHYHELTGDRKGQWACDLDLTDSFLNLMKILSLQIVQVNTSGLK